MKPKTSTPSGTPARGRTQAEREAEKEPRLPHEHDESADSQSAESAEAEEVGRQAHEDVERGLVDTDRGPVADRVYNDAVKPPDQGRRRAR